MLRSFWWLLHLLTLVLHLGTVASWGPGPVMMISMSGVAYFALG